MLLHPVTSCYILLHPVTSCYMFSRALIPRGAQLRGDVAPSSSAVTCCCYMPLCVTVTCCYMLVQLRGDVAPSSSAEPGSGEEPGVAAAVAAVSPQEDAIGVALILIGMLPLVATAGISLWELRTALRQLRRHLISRGGPISRSGARLVGEPCHGCGRGWRCAAAPPQPRPTRPSSRMHRIRPLSSNAPNVPHSAPHSSPLE